MILEEEECTGAWRTSTRPGARHSDLGNRLEALRGFARFLYSVTFDHHVICSWTLKSTENIIIGNAFYCDAERNF